MALEAIATPDVQAGVHQIVNQAWAVIKSSQAN